jgi:hypothetical protein
MGKRLALVVIVLAAAATLGGCSKCDGWWGGRPAACKNEAPR